MAKHPQYENYSDDYEPRKQKGNPSNNKGLIIGVALGIVAVIGMIAFIFVVVFRGGAGR